MAGCHQQAICQTSLSPNSSYRRVSTQLFRVPSVRLPAEYAVLSALGIHADYRCPKFWSKRYLTDTSLRGLNASEEGWPQLGTETTGRSAHETLHSDWRSLARRSHNNAQHSTSHANINITEELLWHFSSTIVKLRCTFRLKIEKKKNRFRATKLRSLYVKLRDVPASTVEANLGGGIGSSVSNITTSRYHRWRWCLQLTPKHQEVLRKLTVVSVLRKYNFNDGRKSLNCLKKGTFIWRTRGAAAYENYKYDYCTKEKNLLYVFILLTIHERAAEARNLKKDSLAI